MSTIIQDLIETYADDLRISNHVLKSLYKDKIPGIDPSLVEENSTYVVKTNDNEFIATLVESIENIEFGISADTGCWVKTNNSFVSLEHFASEVVAGPFPVEGRLL